MPIASLLIALLGQTNPLPVGPPAPVAAFPSLTIQQRHDACLDQATDNPAQAERDAVAWRSQGGIFFARQCLGMAYANEGRWALAADEFAGAAQDAEVAHDQRAAHYWAQAGNAWLAAKEPAKARLTLDAALAAGTLVGLQRGEALFDHARALVLLGELEAARADLDRALSLANADPLIWLSSATLARRMDDLPRARSDIAKAFELSADDPSVYVEIGNIAALGSDETGARNAWADAIRIAPASGAADLARAALAQFEEPRKPANP